MFLPAPAGKETRLPASAIATLLSLVWEGRGPTAKRAHFKTDVGATYTIQKDVDPAPGADDAFGGVRVSVDALRHLSESAQYTSVLVTDANIRDTDDFRADWINSLSVSLSDRLAFKSSFQLLYDHQPALLNVPLFDTGGRGDRERTHAR